jgi:hypothetical protein
VECRHNHSNRCPISNRFHCPVRSRSARQAHCRKAQKPKYNLTGYPVNTQQGYIDGCETAKRTSWAFKDLNRYDKDDQYRMGWDDGFAMCQMKK